MPHEHAALGMARGYSLMTDNERRCPLMNVTIKG